jgi:hypothetical protein
MPRVPQNIQPSVPAFNDRVLVGGCRSAVAARVGANCVDATGAIHGNTGIVGDEAAAPAPAPTGVSTSPPA